jgi:hypothetical protein
MSTKLNDLFLAPPTYFPRFPLVRHKKINLPKKSIVFTSCCIIVFIEHDEHSEKCYDANKCDKMAYKTSVINYCYTTRSKNYNTIYLEAIMKALRSSFLGNNLRYFGLHHVRRLKYLFFVHHKINGSLSKKNKGNCFQA